MGHANMDNNESTNDKVEVPGPVSTLADLDPAQFTQLLANVIGPAAVSVAPTQSLFNATRNDLEEGKILEPPQRPTVAPYTKSLHPAWKQSSINCKTSHIIWGYENKARKQIQEATKQANTCFLFEVAVEQKQKLYTCCCILDLNNKPSSVMEWLDGKHARRAVSQDRYNLVVHIPDGVKEKLKAGINLGPQKVEKFSTGHRSLHKICLKFTALTKLVPKKLTNIAF
ncbi:hypothetical protein BT96DRAFT_937312 [Gymnopus androsaceus JB14]|uniref:Uncharacterized protein n=1 Tax=Gymnopus androsaceus JB14 TaxID=1447944 RepID=A0A6A4HYT0_9AGAR|nr:hypothetical protein BT96DRAFT_937312 [Gymnopus androsaceus JB14]